MKKNFLVTLLMASFYSPAAFTQTFNDVPENYWAFDFIEEIAQRAISTGCGGGNYCPEAPVTRAQMAVFLVRVLGQLKQDFVSVPGSVVRPSSSNSSATLLADATITTGQAGDTFNLGAVQLPDMAEIVGMRCSLRDPDSAGRINILLQRRLLGTTGFSDIIASIATSGAEVTQGFVLRSAQANAAFAFVDNQNYTYFFRVDFLDATITVNGIALQGCSIEIRQ